MMGRTHALSGLAVWAALSIPLDLPAGSVLLGGAVCAGAAVLPDIDHHGSHVARTFGPLTRGFGWAVGKISGGHRNGTHSALGVGLIAAVVFGASAVYTRDPVPLWIGCGVTGVMVAAGLLWGLLDGRGGRGRAAYKKRWHGYLSVVVCALAASAIAVSFYRYGQDAGAFLVGAILVLVLAGAIRPLRIKGWWDDLAPIPVAWLLLFYQVDLSVLPYAVVLGVIVHITGDMVTYGGCPLGWPWSQTMRGVKWFRTGSRIEKRVVAPLLLAVLVTAAAVQAAPTVAAKLETARTFASE